jgi:hypothetical protein
MSGAYSSGGSRQGGYLLQPQVAPVSVQIRKSASVRAVRPLAAGAPAEVYSRGVAAQASVMAGLTFESAGGKAKHHAGVSTKKCKNTKHNGGMASALVAMAELEAEGMNALALVLPFVPKRAPLPNPSVEATNCSKLQFALHLER